MQQQQPGRDEGGAVLVAIPSGSRQEDIARFVAWCQSERSTTRILAGFSDQDVLTPEQETALDGYMRATQEFSIKRWGPQGPRGAVLREETEAEQAARLVWEEAIKSQEQKLQERIEAAALDFWQSGAALPQDRKKLFLVWFEEETDEFQRGFWVEAAAIRQQDRLFELKAQHRYASERYRSPDCVDYDLFFALHPDNSLELLQIRSMSLTINDHFYPIRNLSKMTPQDRADLLLTFATAEEA